MPNEIVLYDTTLRDGSQTEGVCFSTEDKIEILQRLDEFGINMVEGGWPSSNPKDDEFFLRARSVKLKNSRLVAFGSTRRANVKASEDVGLKALMNCGTGLVCLFGKTWDLHVEKALQVSPEENLCMIEESVSYFTEAGIEVIFDAEHFFDGYKENPEYAILCLQAAVKGGASWLVLCDTNGGSTLQAVENAVKRVKGCFDLPVGVHCHNDSELAVACSLVAVQAGASMVQGTINGLGERCGNANLCSIIPNLVLKMGYNLPLIDLSKLTSLSLFVGEMANVRPHGNLPYVGERAFAHKAGVHVSAMSRDTRTYEHTPPETVGNRRRILISDLAGTSSILEKVKEYGIDAGKESGRDILNKIKLLESEGYQFDGAEASFELLVRRFRDNIKPPFGVSGFRLFIDSIGDGQIISEASVKVVDRFGNMEHTAADGEGPVNALDKALRKALACFYPVLNNVRLTDYKVRVLDEKAATAAKVRVLIRSTDGKQSWTTVGVSENIIEASLLALVDSMEYILLKEQMNGSL